MYLEFYDLKSKPFQISTDTRFLWLGEKHKEALATLQYGVMDNKGFLLLTGDVGTGKTTLINALLNDIGQDVIVAFVPDPELDKLDFLNFIAYRFGMNKEFRSKGSFLIHFSKFLHNAYDRNKRVLLILDEAQLLRPELLEEVRLLSNIERQDSKLLNIFFIGQDEFNEVLLRVENRALRQRITINYNIEPLNQAETREYIRYRLEVAGRQRELFNPAAVQEIHNYSGGYPRLINIICDHALLTGFVAEARLIGAEVVRECAKELTIKAPLGVHAKRRQDIQGPPPAPPSPYGQMAQPQPAVFQSRPSPLPVATSAIPQPLKTTPTPQPERPARPPATPARRRHAQAAPARAQMTTPADDAALDDEDLLRGPDRFIRQEAERNKIGYVALLVLLVIGLVYFYFAGITAREPDQIAVNQQAELQQQSRAEMAAPTKTAEESATDLQVEDVREDAPLPAPQSATKAPPAVAASPTTQDVVRPAEELGLATQTPTAPPEAPTAASPGPQPETPLASTSPSAVQGIILPFPENNMLIYFKTNSNELSDAAYQTLEMVAQVMKQYPDADLVVRGFTDNVGDYNYNVWLSKFRANIVKTFLVGKGINHNKIEAFGMGPMTPIETNDTPEGRLANRRVEIEFIR